MSFEWVEEDLKNDYYEQRIIEATQREYYKNKKKEIKHKILKGYSGINLETMFWKYLDTLIPHAVMNAKWLSYEHKTEMDFVLTTHSLRTIYIDVVGTHMRKDRIMLNCNQKDYKKKLRFLKGCDGYLAFVLNGYWRFIKIHDNMPIGDLTMTPGRMKHVKKPSFVFQYMPLPNEIPESSNINLSESARFTGNTEVNIKLESLRCNNVW